MFSLQGAPNLNAGPKKKFSYDVLNDPVEDVPPAVSTEDEEKRSRSKSKEKKKKSKDKKKKDSSKKKKESKHSYDDDYSSSEAVKNSSQKKSTDDYDYDYDYDDDFEDTHKKYDDDFEDEQPAPNYDDDFEEPLDSDDYIPPVESSHTSSAASSKPPVSKPSLSTSTVTKDEERLARIAEEKIRAEREEHDQKVKSWQAEQEKKERELLERQRELETQISSLQKQSQESQAADMKEQIARMLQEQLSTAAAAKQQVAQDIEYAESAQLTEAQRAEAQRAEVQRRRQRERERALSLRRAHEEQAAHSLFQRLAQDVREVFHELNLSVVAAEKERLIKDERYRKEREMKDRREEAERAEKLQKELKEREERDEKFWSAVEQREDKFRTWIEDRTRKDEEERESRLKRDLEDRATRTRNERELRDDIEKMERERREKAESGSRERDNVFLQSQVDEVKLQYRAQLEELKRQAEADRARNEETHRAELKMAEKRHEAAIELLIRQHGRQMASIENHTVNASKLEKLIECMHDDMAATKKMNESLAEERIRALEYKEKHLEEQKAMLTAMMEDMRAGKQDLEKERVRVAGLYAKFEIALSNFSKNSEEDRRRLQESQAHMDTLRQQAEKDRRLMLSEVSQERKLLEQQHEDFISKKMESMGELQAERLQISRERTEAAVARERQNRDETELLQSLRAREEDYHRKLESIEADRVSISEMKREQRLIYEKALAEREAIRKERELFELEKQELLGRFEEVRRRAEDAAGSQDRLRKELVEERAMREFGIGNAAAHHHHVDPGLNSNAVSKLHMDLAKQRAILQKLA